MKNTMTQEQHFWAAHRKNADKINAFMEMVNCKTNPLDRATLQGMIDRWPNRYGMFAHWLDKLPQ